MLSSRQCFWIIIIIMQQLTCHVSVMRIMNHSKLSFFFAKDVMWSKIKVKSKSKLKCTCIHSLTCHTATGIHMPHGITGCYLPPGRGDIPAVIPDKAGTWFCNPGGMQGWVGLLKVPSSRKPTDQPVYINLLLLIMTVVVMMRVECRWMQPRHQETRVSCHRGVGPSRTRKAERRRWKDPELSVS